MPRIDLTNQIFGRLTAVRFTGQRSSRNYAVWECLCECGRTVLVAVSELRKGSTRSCGCMRFFPADLLNKRFGRLTVVRDAGRRSDGRQMFECMCSCGEMKTTTAHSLQCGTTNSCGCLHREKSSENGRKQLTTHGRSNDPTYISWAALLTRCRGKYMSLGITVCDRWQNFENFAADMGDRPSKAHTIDRYPNQRGNYEPGNCRWATAREQQNNKSTNVIVEYRGQTMTVSEAWREAGEIVPRSTMKSRLVRGWSITEAVETPPMLGANQWRL